MSTREEVDAMIALESRWVEAGTDFSLVSLALKDTLACSSLAGDREAARAYLDSLDAAEASEEAAIALDTAGWTVGRIIAARS
jgi:hypothetical protein